MKFHLILIKFLYILLPLIERINGNLKHNRDKRYLIFPQANPTRHQFIAGIGIPVDLDVESVTIGYVFKAQYFLPYNVSQLRPGVFFPIDDFNREKSSRKRRNTNNPYHHHNYEQYTEHVEEIDRRPVANTIVCENHEVVEKRNNLRWDVYKSMEYANYGLGYHGRQCVLRLICEMAGTTIHETSGILADITKLILTRNKSGNCLLSTSTMTVMIICDSLIIKKLGCAACIVFWSSLLPLLRLYLCKLNITRNGILVRAQYQVE